ncbi:MAG: hypothetical protein WD426_12490 [Anditalea sp.]
MKKLIFGFALIALYACSTEEKAGETENNTVNFSFTVTDTLVVDPGEEILFVQYGLHFSNVDENRKYLTTIIPMKMQLR